VTASSRPVTVYMYGDYVCPFTYIGDARLRRLAWEGRLDVRWRPFEIRPAVPPEGLPVRLAGFPPEEWAATVAKVGEMAADMELPLSVPDFLANSHGALQVAEFARDLGREVFETVHGALFRAYFAEGRNLGDHDVLLAVAREAGLDVGAVESSLEDSRYEDELRRAAQEAERYEITGTPTFLFGRFKVVGAAPQAVLRDAYRRAQVEASAAAGEGTGPKGEGEA
jgi:predicted DsbA family dithiol-disulfide isomerase